MPTSEYQIYDFQSNPESRQSGVFYTLYTGGNPGTIAYQWEFVLNSISAIFVNPVTATSQRLAFDSIPDGNPQSCTFRCRLTDSLGAVSYSETVNFTYQAYSGGIP